MRSSLLSALTFVFTLVSLSTLTFADDRIKSRANDTPTSSVIPTDSWNPTASRTHTLTKRTSSLHSLAPIIGGAVGGGVVLILLLLLAVCYFSKRHRHGRVFRVEPFKVHQLSLDATSDPEMGTPNTPGKWHLVERVAGPPSSSSSPGGASDASYAFAPDAQRQRPELAIRIQPRSHGHTPSQSPIPRSALSMQESAQPGGSGCGASGGGADSIASEASLTDEEVRIVKSLYLCGVEPSVVAQVIRSMLDGKAPSATSHGHDAQHGVGVAIGSLEDVQHNPLQFAHPGELEDAVAEPAVAPVNSQMHFLDLDPAVDPNANVDAAWKAKERETELLRKGSMATQISAAPSYTTNPRA